MCIVSGYWVGDWGRICNISTQSHCSPPCLTETPPSTPLMVVFDTELIVTLLIWQPHSLLIAHCYPSRHFSPITLYNAHSSLQGYCSARHQCCHYLDWQLHNMYSMGCYPLQKHWFFSHTSLCLCITLRFKDDKAGNWCPSPQMSHIHSHFPWVLEHVKIILNE